MTKKKTPTEIIESTRKPGIEHRFVKHPGKEIKDVTDYKYSKRGQSLKRDLSTIGEDEERLYTDIHTHPSTYLHLTKRAVDSISKNIGKGKVGELVTKMSEGIVYERGKNIVSFPSGQDIKVLLTTKNEKTMIISVRDTKSGEVLGYHFIKKTKDTPNLYLMSDIAEYEKRIGDDVLKFGSYDIARMALNSIANKYHLLHRLVPAKGYMINESKVGFTKKKEKMNQLEKIVVTTSIIGFLGALVFLSSNVTGKVIGNMTNSTSNWIGGVLFVIGMTGAFVYFRKK